VHPVQLYDSILLFVAAYIVWKSRHLWKRDGSMVVFALILFAFSRFITGFFRDPSTVLPGGGAFPGAGMMQWIMLIAASFLALLLLFYERHYHTTEKRESYKGIPLQGRLICILTVSLLICLFRGLFTPYEIVSVDMRFIPAMVLAGVHIFRSYPRVRVRLATSAFLVVSLFLAAFALPQQRDTTRHGASSGTAASEVVSYKQVDIGLLTGNNLSEVAFNPHEGTCGTSYTHENYLHDFRLAAAGISEVVNTDGVTTRVGINVFGGENREINLTKDYEKTHFLIGVDPWIRYDWKWIGAGAGLMVGNIRWIPLEPIDVIYFNAGTRHSPVMPEFSARFGRRDIIDLRYEYGMGFPSRLPVLFHDLSVGSGFGTKDNLNLRAGLYLGSYSSNNYYISLEGFPGRQIGVGASYYFGKRFPVSFGDPELYYDWLSVRVSYRFGFNGKVAIPMRGY
jgi:phosphatidylglycerol:prolipoprotein diacylglycerol transferase